MIGGILVDKPAGWTSHDVVGKMRRFAGTRRVGHTGTLDPFATGLLIVCVGAATRLSQLLTGCDKEYLATIRFGFATGTQDYTGDPLGPIAPPEAIPVDPEIYRRALAGFSGEQDQLPPMFSAKKVDGKTLYKLAREGKDVERRTVRIRAALDLVGYRDGGGCIARNEDGTVDVEARVVCSAGTYVRTLAHDLGALVGPGAHLAALRRTRIGAFRIEDAAPLDELDGHVAERLVSAAALVAHLPTIRAEGSLLDDVRHGRAVRTGDDAAGFEDGGDCRILAPDGTLLAIGAFDREALAVRPRIVLATGDGS